MTLLRRQRALNVDGDRVTLLDFADISMVCRRFSQFLLLPSHTAKTVGRSGLYGQLGQVNFVAVAFLIYLDARVLIRFQFL